MTALREKIKARISNDGPLTIAQFMSVCLGDPQAGYYIAQDPFGSGGDFVTAPEVSQMFGELIGASLLSAHEALGFPAEFQLVELGPGRGTLMSDLLRTATLRPEFLQAAQLHLVETSPRLRAIQSETLARSPLKPLFHDRFEEVPDGPLLLVANEFFDALPIHQFVKTTEGWRERQVGLDKAGNLFFGVGASMLELDLIPVSCRQAPVGSILETQPAANAIAEQIGQRLSLFGGAAIFIDYGYLKTAVGDTLQALRNHAFDEVLANPGEADLTAHVNFEALAEAAAQSGAKPLPAKTQADFLLQSGLLERAGSLGAGKSHEEQETIRDAVERLAAPDQMGELFKVLAITGGDVSFAPFDRRS